MRSSGTGMNTGADNGEGFMANVETTSPERHGGRNRTMANTVPAPVSQGDDERRDSRRDWRPVGFEGPRGWTNWPRGQLKWY
jgi:hypothetical protein